MAHEREHDPFSPQASVAPAAEPVADEKPKPKTRRKRTAKKAPETAQGERKTSPEDPEVSEPLQAALAELDQLREEG